MTDASTLLRSARASRRISQTQLAQLTGVDKSTLSLIESSKRNPSVRKLSLLLRATGSRLTVIPTTRSGSLEVGADIRNDLARDDQRQALRDFIHYSDNLAAETGVNRVVLAVNEAETTGSPLWDAAVAGVTEYWLERDSLPVPEWVAAESRFLGTETILTDNPYTLRVDRAAVPWAFLRRGVLVDESTLQSV